MKVSIITITYNSSLTLSDTLYSVNNQVYNNIEHVIVDGLSQDNTLAIAKKFPHISKIISEPDRGVYDAMNKGIKYSSGEIIGILNSDDVYVNKNIISIVVDQFKQHPNTAAVYGNISFFKTETPDKIERVWKSKPYYDDFFEDGEVAPHPALFVKKEVYNKIGLYYPDFKIASDYEFMLRMLKIHKYNSIHLNKMLVRMRLGGDSTSGIHNLILNNKEVLKAWKMNDLTPPVKFYLKRPIKKILQLFSND